MARVSSDHNPTVLHSASAGQSHPTRNGTFTAYSVTSSSGQLILYRGFAQSAARYCPQPSSTWHRLPIGLASALWNLAGVMFCKNV